MRAWSRGGGSILYGAGQGRIAPNRQFGCSSQGTRRRLDNRFRQRTAKWGHTSDVIGPEAVKINDSTNSPSYHSRRFVFLPGKPAYNCHRTLSIYSGSRIAAALPRFSRREIAVFQGLLVRTSKDSPPRSLSVPKPQASR